MKNPEWLMFSWDIAQIPAGYPATPKNYTIRQAEKKELPVVMTVATSAFSLDSEWGRFVSRLEGLLKERFEAAFEAKDPPCLVLTHGTRVVATSLLDPRQEAEFHLVSGPCILMEYRSRGLGTLLLQHSLRYLADAGLDTVRAVTRREGPAARFVYPKFHGMAQPYQLEFVSHGA